MFSRRRLQRWRRQQIPVGEEVSQSAIPGNASEARFQEWCEDVARRYGWVVHHSNDSRRADAGLPDLVMLSPVVKGNQVVLAVLELKSATGKLTKEQTDWQAGLSAATTLVTGVLRPSDWQQFVALCFDPAGLAPDEAPPKEEPPR